MRIAILLVMSIILTQCDHNTHTPVDRDIYERPKPKVTGNFGFKWYKWEYIEINHHRFVVGMSYGHGDNRRGYGLMSHDPDCPNKVCEKIRLGKM
jgi:hypothetical protein